MRAQCGRSARLSPGRRSTWPKGSCGGRRPSSMPSLASERATVQNPLVAYAAEIGWQHLQREMALTLRQGAGGTLLYSVLRDKLIALNPGVVTAESADQIIRRLPSLPTHIQAHSAV